MKLAEAFEILRRVRQKTGHRDLVVIGSNASLAFAKTGALPAEMTMSTDLGCYTKDDPGRIFDVVGELGEGSPFHKKIGYYLDAVSPHLPALPDGWEARMLRETSDGDSLWFIDPNDAAISKYARGEPRDRRWIQAGLVAGIVSLPRVRILAGHTSFLDKTETAAVFRRIDEDAAWLASRPRESPLPTAGPRSKP